MSVLLKCYNKGCGGQFDPSINEEDSCNYHPGAPIFHDAYKSWSCCNKKSIDFTQFLNYPGCTKGLHNNELPKKPETTNSEEIKSENNIPDPIQKPMERPSVDETKTSLKTTIAPSLQQLLNKKKLEECNDPNQLEEGIRGIKFGESCKNSGCKTSYDGPETDLKICNYHPGAPVFHEGLKFWSCCERKTTNFDNFLEQDGCTRGKHIWCIENDSLSKKVNCRLDWHQTAKFVTISVFAKLIVPEETLVEINKVSMNLKLCFEYGKSLFQKSVILQGVIDPEGSNVKLLGTKCEINLLKAEPGTWSKLELPIERPVIEDDSDDDLLDEIE